MAIMQKGIHKVTIGEFFHLNCKWSMELKREELRGKLVVPDGEICLNYIK